MTTLLEAVNRTLSAAALRPVTSLEDPVAATTALARRFVEEEHLSAQNSDWQFNREPRATLLPDVDGIIEVGETAIRWVDEASTYVTIRGTELYDLERATNVFSGRRRGELVRRLDFELCPSYYGDYVAARAARRMHAQYRGDPAGARDAVANEVRAQTLARNQDADMARRNSVESPSVRSITGRPRSFRRFW